jgi:hypothetical protein
LADPTAGVHPVVGFNHATELQLSGALDSARWWYDAVAGSAQEKSLVEVERRALIGVARTSARLGDLERARSAFRRVLLLAGQQGRPVERESLFVAASIALAEDDTLRAASGFERVLRLDGFFEGHPTRRSRSPLLDLARITLERGHYAEARDFALALRRLGLVDSLAAVRSADVGQADLLAARAYRGLGRTDSAVASARAAVAALTAGLGAQSPAAREATGVLDSVLRRSPER